MIKIFFVFIVIIHGLIHLMGFVKGYNFAEMTQLTQPISKASGILWLITFILFLVTIVLFLLKNDYWWILGLVAILLSQILIIQNWNDAKFGTLANLLILIPVIVSLMSSLPSSFQNIYRAEVQKKLIFTTDVSVVSEEDIEHLPTPVQKYLQYVGAIGKPKIHNFRVVASGGMKRSIKDNWIDISSQQYNFFDDPSRFFYIKSSLFGVPFDGLHAYTGSIATMKIKVASLLQVVNANGEKMNQSENVTLFNDMCLFAPATLIDKSIQWETIDPLTVKAKFTHNNITISALLYFNEKGELINFISDDRYLSADGKTYTKYQWSTPIKDYKEFDGRKVQTYGEAVWHIPEGEFVYAKFNIKEIEYNLKKYIE